MVVSLDQPTTRRSGKSRPASATPVQVGTELREAREAMGSSLAEVHDRTGILWRELEALESGDLRKMPDRQIALVALHHYAVHLGLDEWPLARVIERNWWPSRATHPPTAISVASPCANPWAPMDTGRLILDPGDSATQAGGIREDPTATILGIGADVLYPSYRYPRQVDVAAPLPLRVAVWLVAVLLVVGGAGLAAKHGAASWLGDIHWGPAPTPTFAASQNTSGSIASSASKPEVVLVSSGIGSAAVSVRAAQFSVVLVPTARCWVQVTTASSAVPVFAGILQPGDEKIIDAVAGQLTVQLGAGGVTVQVQVRGQIVPGWSFRPSVAPAILSFASSPVT